MWSNRQELHDAEAERARQHLPEPTMPWRAPGARVVAVGGPPGDRVGGPAECQQAAGQASSTQVSGATRYIYTIIVTSDECARRGAR